MMELILDFLIVACRFSGGFLLALILGLIFSPNRNKMLKRTLISSIIYLIIAVTIVYFALPPQTLSNLLMLNGINFLIGMAVMMLISVDKISHLFIKPSLKNKQIINGPGGINRRLTKFFVWGVIAVVGLIIYTPIARIISIDDVFNTIDVKKVKKTEELVSTKETPIAMSIQSAQNKMQKMISSVPNYSAYQLGSTTAQVIDGEYVYVAALEYRSFWKWNRFKEVPGYFKISATDINAQPEFINKKMRYIPSAYLGQDAERKIYAKASRYATIGTVNLEIGNDGTPYYVETLYKEYGVSGIKRYDDFKVGVLNSVTGETKVYELKDTPKDIDAPLTSAVASSMNSYFGLYGKGWLNSLFTKDDVKQPTNNGIYSKGAVTPLLSKSGELLYFTDFTSDDAKQDSALGYSLINARTGVMEYYRDGKGMMDSDGAIQIAEKIYPEKKWEAKMPILYNVEGVPTWVVSLLDVNGIFKGYVYISATDSDIVVDGNDAQKTLEAYKLRLGMKGSSNKNVDKLGLEKVSGEVRRVNKMVIEGNETVSFLLKDNPTVYTISTSNNVYSMFLTPGDKVSFEATIDKDSRITTIDDITIDGVTTEK
ncbi:DNA-binding protein [Vagococcus penaei]|nr:DNA-binding protein [Vagococcus penaei]